MRLPRARGDRPGFFLVYRDIGKTAPRTRGSTFPLPFRMPRVKDCPAHAGIDPRACHRRFRPYRLPRARGDRPGNGPDAMQGDTTAPRTRGSTSDVETAMLDTVDCPAHAGIDHIGLQAGEE